MGARRVTARHCGFKGDLRPVLRVSRLSAQRRSRPARDGAVDKKDDSQKQTDNNASCNGYGVACCDNCICCARNRAAGAFKNVACIHCCGAGVVHRAVGVQQHMGQGKVHFFNYHRADMEHTADAVSCFAD